MGKQLISQIREVFLTKDYQYTKHGAEQRVNRKISDEEIRQVITSGEIIEEYPHDKYGPSCLIYGKTLRGRPLHIQVSLPPIVKVITTYKPDPKEWIDYKIRRGK